MVSSSLTYLPSRPVNWVATKNGWDRKRCTRRARATSCLSQPFFVATQFTGLEGKYVKLEDTINSFERVVAGEFDQLPEQAFYMVGGIDEVVEQAKRLAST